MKTSNSNRQGGVIGCVAYHPIPILQHGAIGRKTILIVQKERRREGIGTALLLLLLLLEAEKRLRNKGCVRIEIANEVSLRNAAGCLRARGYENRLCLHLKEETR